MQKDSPSNLNSLKKITAKIRLRSAEPFFCLHYVLFDWNVRLYVRRMKNEVELLFMDETLTRHGKYLKDLFVQSIQKNNLIFERDLVDGIVFSVAREGANPKLTFTFPMHGRFIEIRFFKVSANTNKWNDALKESTDAAWGRSQEKIKDKRKKDARWYSKNLYGSLNDLIGKIMYELSEEERIRLKSIIEQRNAI